MELIFTSRPFEICVRIGHKYNFELDKFLGPALNVRFGKTLWSTGKGWRKLGE